MKMLKKLALVSAISVISAGAFAMEAMDDESMAAATGQDGITIKIIPGVIAGGAAAQTDAVTAQTAFNAKFGVDAKFSGTDLNGAAAGGFGYKGLVIGEIRIHDDDGIVGNTDAGAIVIGTNGTLTDSTVVYADGTEPIGIDIDSVGNGGAPLLNIKITTPSLLGVKTGKIYVATSSDTVSVGDGMQDTVGSGVGKVEILDSLHMSVGGVALNIQLGNEAQGAMIKVSGALTGGLSITDFALNDAGGTMGITKGGKIAIGSMAITDAGVANANLTLDVSVDVATGDLDGDGAITGATETAANNAYNGLVITMTTLGQGSGIDIDMKNVGLGMDTDIVTAGWQGPDMGDVQLLGLNVDGTKIVIRGH